MCQQRPVLSSFGFQQTGSINWFDPQLVMSGTRETGMEAVELSGRHQVEQVLFETKNPPLAVHPEPSGAEVTPRYA